MADAICGVYAIVHKASGKRYVGSSGDVNTRWRKHKEVLRRGKHHSKHLQNAWNKHGESAFAFVTLWITTLDSQLQDEQCCLDYMKPEYNWAKTAGRITKKGDRIPDEWRENISRGLKELYSGGHKMQRRPWSIENRQRIGREVRQRYESDAYRTKMKAAIRGGITSELCAIRSENAKKLWSNPAYHAKASAARRGNSFATGYRCTPEQVENRKRAGRISNAKRKHKERWREEYAKMYPDHKEDLI